MVRLTPQEKKRLSYAKDRRNNYGENDKSSRKNIRRNKRAPHRANRHHAHQVLGEAAGALAVDAADTAEQRLLAKRPKSWKKWPDMPLGDFVVGGLQRRLRLGIDDAASVAARIGRIRQRLRQPPAESRKLV